MDHDYVRNRIEAITDTEVCKFLEQLPERIEDILSRTLLHTLGVKSGWAGQYELDKTNGRVSPLSALITRGIEDYAKGFDPRELVESILSDTKGKMPFWQKGIRKDIINIYCRAFQSKIEDSIRGQAVEDAQRFLQELSDRVVIGTLGGDGDPMNPDSFKGLVGELFLQLEAKLIAERQAKEIEVT